MNPIKITDIFNRQDMAYVLADVLKEVVVDLRKGFHLFAELCNTLGGRAEGTRLSQFKMCQ